MKKLAFLYPIAVFVFSLNSFSITRADFEGQWEDCKDLLRQAQLKLDDWRKTTRCFDPESYSAYQKQTSSLSAWKEHFGKVDMEVIEINSKICKDYVPSSDLSTIDKPMDREITEPVIVSLKPLKGTRREGFFHGKKKRSYLKHVKSAVSFGGCGVKIPRIRFVAAFAPKPSDIYMEANYIDKNKSFYKEVSSPDEKSWFVDVEIGNYSKISYKNLASRVPRRNEDGSVNKNPVVFFVRDALDPEDEDLKRSKYNGKAGGFAASRKSQQSIDDFSTRSYSNNVCYVGSDSKTHEKDYLPGSSTLAHELGHLCTEQEFGAAQKKAGRMLPPNLMSHTPSNNNGDFGFLCPMVRDCEIVTKTQ
jgi:hypothetical protein